MYNLDEELVQMLVTLIFNNYLPLLRHALPVLFHHQNVQSKIGGAKINKNEDLEMVFERNRIMSHPHIYSNELVCKMLSIHCNCDLDRLTTDPKITHERVGEGAWLLTMINVLYVGRLHQFRQKILSVNGF